MVWLFPQATRDGRLRRRVWVPFGVADLFVVVGMVRRLLEMQS